MKIRELTAANVDFELTIEAEDAPLITSIGTSRPAFDSGDRDADLRLAEELQARLDRGDLWAWCVVVVTARWGALEGTTALGCCSYDDEEDFKKDSGNYEQMKDDALADLNHHIKSIAETVGPVIQGDSLNVKLQQELDCLESMLFTTPRLSAEANHIRDLLRLRTEKA